MFLILFLVNKGLPDEAIWKELNAPNVIPGRVIVKLKQSENRFDKKWTEIFEKFDAKIIKRSVSNTANFIVVELENKDKGYVFNFIKSITTYEGVEYAEPDLKAHILYEPNDPYYDYYQWGPQFIKADSAWDIEKGSMSVTLTVIDQGVMYDHPDLQDRFVGNNGYDFVDDDNDPYPDDLYNEDHGTHVAGIAAATMDNSEGIAGIAQVRIVSLRALDESGSGSYSDIADAIYYAGDSLYDVVNMSLGGPVGGYTLENACDYAWNRGCLLVAASGNDGADSISFPARYSSVIAVGALDPDSSLADYSNYGPEQELTAPGTDILSAVPYLSWTFYDYYDYMSGTSMASPHVAGVAALVKSHYPNWTNQQIRNILIQTAMDLGASGWDKYYGYGCVDAYRALSGFAGNEVWPGDANNDGIVNVWDVLPIGLYYGETGEARSDSGTLWQGYPLPQWNNTMAAFADCNGDGKVDEKDVLIISLHWHKTHSGAKPFNLDFVKLFTC